jgi:hypothetical protein
MWSKAMTKMQQLWATMSSPDQANGDDATQGNGQPQMPPGDPVESLAAAPDPNYGQSSTDLSTAQASADPNDGQNNPDSNTAQASADPNDGQSSPDFATAQASADPNDGQNSPDFSAAQASADPNDGQSSPDFSAAQASADPNDGQSSPDFSTAQASPNLGTDQTVPDQSNDQPSPDLRDDPPSPDANTQDPSVPATLVGGQTGQSTNNQTAQNTTDPNDMSKWFPMVIDLWKTQYTLCGDRVTVRVSYGDDDPKTYVYRSPSPLKDSSDAHAWAATLPLRPEVQKALSACVPIYNRFGEALNLARSAASTAEEIANTVTEIAGVGTVIAGLASIAFPLLAPVAKVAGGITAEAVTAKAVADQVLRFLKSLSDGPYHDLGKAIDDMKNGRVLPANWQDAQTAIQKNLHWVLQSIVDVTRAKERIAP